ncbi:hypothetical protein FIBSPDRAFT_903442 [Athelia psychrophila]|uniref:Uncharacterized protein n=1 Tax=Athelia psychrophila TaxID=1759441 RepID=A0A167VZ94_9AGAM|nr:hypothetical protein FIBSPDRAFT_903442 [Fibularhizoctonia sp. CBS 109695]
MSLGLQAVTRGPGTRESAHPIQRICSQLRQQPPPTGSWAGAVATGQGYIKIALRTPQRCDNKPDLNSLIKKLLEFVRSSARGEERASAVRCEEQRSREVFDTGSMLIITVNATSCTPVPPGQAVPLRHIGTLGSCKRVGTSGSCPLLSLSLSAAHPLCCCQCCLPQRLAHRQWFFLCGL